MHSIIPIVFETIVCLSILYSARLPSDVKRFGLPTNGHMEGSTF